MLKRNKFPFFFSFVFLSKRFSEKYEDTELALDFVQKQYFC